MKTVLITQAAWDAERMFGPMLAKLEQTLEVIHNPADRPLTEDEVISICRSRPVEVIVTGWGGVRLTPAIIDAAPELELVAVFGGAVSPYAPEYAMSRGVHYCHCPKAMGYCVAEFTVGLMLSLGYEIGYFDRLIRDEHRSAPPEGEYQKRGGFVAKSLRYAEVGLIGSGNIARHVIRMLAPFDCRISVYDPFLSVEAAKKLGVKKAAKLETLLKKADIISVHAGWTRDTVGMLSAEKLALLKDDAMVICTARMPIFDEAALKREALSGRLRVALNLIPENPIWFEDDLRGVRKLLLSPGSASVSSSTWLDMGKMLLTDVLQFAERGKLGYEVKPSDLVKMT